MGATARKSAVVGSLIMDKACGTVAGREVGKIRRRCGTDDPKVHSRYVAMCDSLIKMGRADLLLALKTGERDFASIYALFETQKLNSIPVILAGDQLETVLMDWLETAKKRKEGSLSDNTKREYRNSFTQMLKLAGPDATIKDIPSLLSQYRDQCQDNEHWSPFNNCRTALLSFARSTEKEKQYSDLYHAINKMEGLTTARKRELHGLPVSKVKELMTKFTPEMAQHVWNLYATGMRLDEYASADWSIEKDRININGTKNKAAKRFVPKVAGVVKTPFPKSTFQRTFREATKDWIAEGEGLVPNDLRGSYQQLLDQCVPNLYRIDKYEGHVSKNVKKGYRSHVIEPFLKSDAKAIEKFIASNLEPPKDEEVAA